MSILTYKIKHNQDLSVQLKRAMKLARFSVNNKNCRSSKDVRQFGLPSAISNQILRKYGGNRKSKSVHRVKLGVPGQSIFHKDELVRIKCIGIELKFELPVEKILQAEVDETFVYLSCRIQDQKIYTPAGWIGIDRNSTGHVVVAALPTGKVLKLGAQAGHVSRKYRAMRKDLQKKGKTRRLKKIRTRESNIVKDINHKASRIIVDLAKKNNWGIKLEQLKNIRTTAKKKRRKPKGQKQLVKQKQDRAILHSWSFHQFGTFIGYKTKLLGVPLIHVDPRYTSKGCAKCGLLGHRQGKQFKCPHCGHVEHADVNAAFNIALRPEMDSVFQSGREWDLSEGSTDTPQWATP